MRFVGGIRTASGGLGDYHGEFESFEVIAELFASGKGIGAGKDVNWPVQEPWTTHFGRGPLFIHMRRASVTPDDRCELNATFNEVRDKLIDHVVASAVICAEIEDESVAAVQQRHRRGG